MEIATRAAEGGTLASDFLLKFDAHGWVSVEDVLKDWRKLDNATLADPLEPDYNGGRNIAKFYANNGERFIINSQAHGGIIYECEPPTGWLLCVDRKNEPRHLPENQMAKVLALRLPDLMFDVTAEKWYRFFESKWEMVSGTHAKKAIENLMGEGCEPVGFQYARLNAMESFLRLNLANDLKQVNDDLLPFKNGVLVMSTGAFIEHDMSHNLTWQLPYDYSHNAQK